MGPDGDITTDRTLRLTVSEAAGALGISGEAVRQRIKRGTLATERDADGGVFVLLDADRMRPDADRTNDRTNDLALLQAHLDSMSEQVGYLKAVIQTRDEELRRKDHIIAALTERIPELEAAKEAPLAARESGVNASDGTDKGDDLPPEYQGREKPSWWHRLFYWS